ncbi:hypothetical protein SFBNYU_011730 [Candidatus Arthromitus sp. SFB-mouse-NYU]|nr:hypothetical protein SFBNYU_011730 [Candidatus Arthromitus sp. SFB-mouse-NYU]
MAILLKYRFLFLNYIIIIKKPHIYFYINYIWRDKMKYRRATVNKRNIKYGDLIKFITSFVLVLILSIFISSNIASFIYESSTYKKSEIDLVSEENENNEKLEEEKLENYSKSLLSNNIVLFQGGVFNDLDNAEEFRRKIDNKVLSSIVNDGKYERVILGVSTKNNFLDMADFLKKNNIQFVKQVYKIPLNVEYNEEILKILEIFSNFILNDIKNVLSDEVDVTDLKSDIDFLDINYGNKGSYKLFNDLRDLILDLDDKVEKEDLESVFNFVYSSFADYKL